MTAAPLPDPLRVYLADPQVRRSLASLVQARVPARDAEDVVQSVLCAALAADAVPDEPSHLPRWIAGITRHKVADAHRRAYREPPIEDAEIEVPAPAFEARQLAERVAVEAAANASARRTLEWIAREHDGETLAEIARAERLPGAVVRKRVSRLRRALRVRWLGAFALVLLGGGFAANRLPRTGGEVVADDRGGSALAGRGDWRVEQIDFDPKTAPEIQALARLEAQGARIQLEGTRVRVITPVRTTTYRILTAHRDAETRETLVLREDVGIARAANAREHRVVVTRDGAVKIHIDEAKWSASVTLRPN